MSEILIEMLKNALEKPQTPVSPALVEDATTLFDPRPADSQKGYAFLPNVKRPEKFESEYLGGNKTAIEGSVEEYT